MHASGGARAGLWKCEACGAHRGPPGLLDSLRLGPVLSGDCSPSSLVKELCKLGAPSPLCLSPPGSLQPPIPCLQAEAPREV